MSQPGSNEMQAADFGPDPSMAGHPGAAPMQPMGPGMPAPQAPSLPKQRFNVYTMMLIISFFALLTASLLLWFELTPYLENGGSWPPWNTSAVGLLEPCSAVSHLL